MSNLLSSGPESVVLTDRAEKNRGDAEEDQYNDVVGD